MAVTNTFKTRIQHKIDTLAEWKKHEDFVPLEGELCIVIVPLETANKLVPQEPAILFKIGHDNKTFGELDFVSAKAADVYDWAKNDVKPTYNASEIIDLDTYISGQVQDTNTKYKIVQDTADRHKFKLQKKDIGDAGYVDVGTWITIPDNDTKYDTKISEIENLLGNESVADQIAGVVGTLTEANVAAEIAAAKQAAIAENKLNTVKVNGRALTADAQKAVDITIESGTGNGSIKVNGADVAVKGLSDLAYKSKVAESDLNSTLKASVDAALRSGNVNGNTVEFYTSTDKTGSAVFTFDFPKELFLDQTKTVFVDKFVWSSVKYPGSANPSLDGKPVMVLAVKGEGGNADTCAYSFIDMSKLVDTYKAKTTGKDASTTVTISGYEVDVKVNISAAQGNILEAKSDGLYAKHQDISGKADKVQSATNGHLAALDANGNLKDSGKTTSDFVAVKNGYGLISSADQQKIDNLKAMSTKDKVSKSDLDTNLTNELNGKTNDSSLKPIAKSGDVKDLGQTDGDVIVFNCGSASTVI